ncbi:MULTISPECIES: sensor histidine kinase [Streptomyces]|uniref:histidine kinase n=1 Tax=Streptomyces spinosisporus TaxID=2927582 RepID=A0ABS9XPE0_9ACTN|nr:MULTISPECIES: histidine kinase [Streptomyces]MCI3243888.1 histidine kinase [Streptomyces spinosisporus]WUB39250.1 histidine kinase [Streptomyces sp. NBC_00588]
MREFVRLLLGRRARLRWVHLILGGALAMPYVFVGATAVGPLTGSQNVFGDFGLQLASFAVALPLAAVTSLFPLTRPLESSAVRWLCGVDAERLVYGPARARGAKARTAAWFTLHLGFGGVIAGMSLAVPPFAGVLIALPLFAWLRDSRLGLPEILDRSWALALSPVAGLACLVALAGCAAGAGALLAHLAPRLLGPAPEDRLAAAEARAADLAVRNRLARELHDSVGHALSAVTLQASAARRVLDSDPEFVREALAAIEDTTRRTVAELDTVLGVLRDGDAPGTGPAPTLAGDLDGLLRRVRASGLRVTATVTADPAALPPALSREAYRIVQEGLSNCLKHAAAPSRVTLHITATDDHLTITVENPLGTPTPCRPGGGHGLRGIADRTRLLGGTTEAGPTKHHTWRLQTHLPLKDPT